MRSLDKIGYEFERRSALIILLLQPFENFGMTAHKPFDTVQTVLKNRGHGLLLKLL
jgi:hypothetical protein